MSAVQEMWRLRERLFARLLRREFETGERTLPMQHELKCWPVSFEAIVDGTKTSEFRCTDDRHFEAGDTLLLREFVVPAGDESAEGAGGYTGQSVTVQVSHVDEGPRWGIPVGYAMLSVEIRPHPPVDVRPIAERVHG